MLSFHIVRYIYYSTFCYKSILIISLQNKATNLFLLRLLLAQSLPAHFGSFSPGLLQPLTGVLLQLCPQQTLPLGQLPKVQTDPPGAMFTCGQSSWSRRSRLPILISGTGPVSTPSVKHSEELRSRMVPRLPPLLFPLSQNAVFSPGLLPRERRSGFLLTPVALIKPQLQHTCPHTVQQESDGRSDLFLRHLFTTCHVYSLREAQSARTVRITYTLKWECLLYNLIQITIQVAVRFLKYWFL